jgi:phosphoribosylglycinamide formyltransferase-1
LDNSQRKNIAILASGSGTNAERIIKYFKESSEVSVRILLSNKPDAYVLTRAENHNIPTYVFTRDEFYKSNQVINLLEENEIDWIVLAGFLWLVPQTFIASFKGKIINIHPALLPKYGGKGMYGMHVHQAIIDAGDSHSGISIHYVNEKFDEGEIIFQAKCEVTSNDTPESLAQKIHQLEYEYFPKVIEELLISK